MRKCPNCRKLFDRAVRACVAYAVATIPVLHSDWPAATGGHPPIAVTVLSQPLGYVPFQTVDMPEMPHLPDADYATNREMAINMSTALRVSVIDPETSDD